MEIVKFPKLLEKAQDGKGYYTDQTRTKRTNRGYKLEFELKSFYSNSILKFKQDTTPHWEKGDINRGRGKWQVKSKGCSMKVTTTDKEQAIEEYLSKDVANKYIYCVEVEETNIGIKLSKQEFKQFLQDKATIGKASKTHKPIIQISVADRTVLKYFGIIV